MKARPSKTDWKTVESLPWGTDEDSEGNACVKLKCKRKAKGIRKGSHPPEAWEFKVPIFDAKGCPAKRPLASAEAGAWLYWTSQLAGSALRLPLGVGLTLSIQSVQITKVVEYTGQPSEKFDAVEGGWTENQAEVAEITTQQAVGD